MNIIIANYGNDSIAAMQWALEAQLANLSIVSIDTGWAAQTWQQRVQAGQQYARDHGIEVVRLTSAATFAEQVKDRKEFPSPKFQWCPSMLKALPLLDWLDQVDLSCSATLIFGKRRSASRASALLPETIAQSEPHGDRKVFYPLYKHSLAERDALIARAGFEVLPHRSLECDPCIHNTPADFARTANTDIDKTAKLEQEIAREMFASTRYNGAIGIKQIVQFIKSDNKQAVQQYQENFDMSCGSPWGCGE